MSVVYNNTAYGLSGPLPNIPSFPIVSSARAPLTTDDAAIGTLWIYTTSNQAYILTSVVAGSANWILIESSGGAGVFTTVTASGNIVSTAGNITATLGNIVASAGNITVSSLTGTIASANTMSAAAGLSGQTVYATGDAGGVASQTGITNVTSTTQSTGTLAIKSESANPGNNAGFIKIYIGTTTAYVPYFTTISP